MQPTWCVESEAKSHPAPWGPAFRPVNMLLFPTCMSPAVDLNYSASLSNHLCILFAYGCPCLYLGGSSYDCDGIDRDMHKCPDVASWHVVTTSVSYAYSHLVRIVTCLSATAVTSVSVTCTIGDNIIFILHQVGWCYELQ